MPLPISLREFVNELDAFDDDWQVHINRRTGEFHSTSEDERRAAGGEEDEEEWTFPPENPERMQKIREALECDDWLPLPSKFDLDEYRIMRDFCDILTDRVLAADLADTIGGRGTFSRFKNMLHRHNLTEAWYPFRANAFREIAMQWLEAHDIPFRE